MTPYYLTEADLTAVSTASYETDRARAYATEILRLRAESADLQHRLMTARSDYEECEKCREDDQAVNAETLKDAAALRAAATHLLALKRGPRDAAYYASRGDAWDSLSAALAGTLTSPEGDTP